MTAGATVELGVEVELLAPTLLSAGPPASNLLETLDFIPGNALRGVLARRYLDAGGGAPDALFERLFVRGPVRFGCGFVGGAEPIPRSARSCKYDGGFRNDGDHGVVDLLLPGKDRPVCGFVRPDGKPCRRPLDYLQGFWLPAEQCSAKVHTRLITRTAIDAGTGRARSGQLYSQRVLDEGQRFAATIEAPADLAAPLQELLSAPFDATLGTGASRGQGHCRIAPAARERTGRAARADRADRGSAASRSERFREAAGRPVLTVTLLSDALFVDDYLRDATAPSEDDLRGLGVDPEEWDLVRPRAFVEARRVFGFDGPPLLLPRSARLAVAAGSAYLYAAREGVADPRIPGGDGLGWIGARRREGHGRALLWHPFHLLRGGEGA